MDDQLYDEFGNYIGPELNEEEEQEEQSLPRRSTLEDVDDEDDGMIIQDHNGREDEEENRGDEMEEEENTMQIRKPRGGTEIVLHEDKKYYPDADEVYGQDTEVLVQDEDTQPLEKPIIQKIKQKKWDLRERTDIIPQTTYSKEYMTSFLDKPELTRNIVIMGHLHHGKTSFVDLLLQHTHVDYQYWEGKEIHYTDVRNDEQRRKLSVKASPISFLLENSKDKNYLFNIIDTPGHVNFSDEVSASLRIADGAVLIVDALEGVMIQTERLIKHALQEKVPIVLVINKIDRLILELKLPPTDAYFKLKHTIAEVNQIIETLSDNFQRDKLSPDLGNVCFASSLMGFCFSIQSFAQQYATYYKSFDGVEFGKRLWGDIYFNNSTRRFIKSSLGNEDGTAKRTFVEFILEPLYKIVSHTVGKDTEDLRATLKKIGVRMDKTLFDMDIKPLLRNIFTSFFGKPKAFVDMVVKHIPSSYYGNAIKVDRHYTGDLSSDVAQRMMECDSTAPLVIYITKLFTKEDTSGFDAFGRVMSGTVKSGIPTKVLGERYSLTNEEDMAMATIGRIYLLNARYKIQLEQAYAGNLILIEGVDASIIKTATIVSRSVDEAYIFRPLKFDTVSVVKVAVEPLVPSELPKMVEGLRKINKSYPLAETKVEASGEHIIMGTGELYMDSLLHDLRKMYAEIEIKVSDPVVTFSETIVDTSAIKCFAETPNKKNKFTFIAEPLEKGLVSEIETSQVSLQWNQKRLTQFFSKYGWDALAANSVWAFGPEQNSPNALLNETLPNEINPKLLSSVKDSVVQGFKWATREGPLCDEPIRNCKFKLLEASIATDAISRGGGQIIPTARRVVYSAFLTATPRLMEPVYHVEIEAPLDCKKAVFSVLERRRGHVLQEAPKAGTPLYIIKAYVPVMDSFGLETDVRVHTQGQAFCLSIFHHWSLVPGDPLDKSIILRPLEPAPTGHLAREFMLKTRRRKGLTEEISINKYFDTPMLDELARQGMLEEAESLSALL